MSKVKKYDPFGYDGLSAFMTECEYGDFVRYKDYAALEAELARLRAGQEPVRFWFIGDAGQQKGATYCKKSSRDGSLAFFECEEDAKRAALRHPGTEVYPVEYYCKPQATPQPSAVPDAITMADVMRAWEYAEDHPHKYLRGTTNWCAAVAHSLNQRNPSAPATVQGDALRPLYICIGKGGEYRYLGTAIGAGDSRGELVEVYQDENGQLYHRTPEDFMERMEPIAAARQEGGKV